MSAFGKAPKNSPRQAQGRPGRATLGSTTITSAPSTRKSCRTKPSQRLSTPGERLWNFGRGGCEQQVVPRIVCAGGDIEAYLLDLERSMLALSDYSPTSAEWEQPTECLERSAGLPSTGMRSRTDFRFPPKSA